MIATSFATRFSPFDGKKPITIFGTEGTIKVPDPNGFDGPVFVQKLGEKEYTEVPHTVREGLRPIGRPRGHGLRHQQRPARCAPMASRPWRCST